MALKVSDRVIETTTTTGTGTIALGGAANGFRRFGDVLADGDGCYYAMSRGSEWEVGRGTYAASGNTLARTAVIASSSGSARVSFSAGSKDVRLTMPGPLLARLLPDGPFPTSFLFDYAAPRDGATDVGALLTQALSETASAGVPLVVENKGFPYLIATPILLPANARLILLDAPLFTTELGTVLTVTGADASIEGRFRLQSAHSTSSYSVLVDTGGQRFRGGDFRFANGNSGINITAPDVVIGDVFASEMRGTTLKFSGTAATRCRVGDVRTRNGAGFGVYSENGAARNTCGFVNKWAVPGLFTAWQMANRPETADNRIGLEAVGLTRGGDEYQIAAIRVQGSGDAGCSLSSDRNVVGILHANDCELNGVSLIGEDNVVGAGSAKNCRNGASFTPNAGGLSRRNVLANFTATGNRENGIQNRNALYRLWVSGASYPSPVSYCRYGLNVYREANGGDTTVFGTSPPVHTSGTVSDGVNTWTWVNSDPLTLDARDNRTPGCRSYGNAGDDWREDGDGFLIRDQDSTGEVFGTSIGYRGWRTVSALSGTTLTLAPGTGTAVALSLPASSSITDIVVSAFASYPLLILTNDSSDPVTIVHDNSKIRLNAKADVVLGLNQTITLIRKAFNVWQQVGGLTSASGTVLTDFVKASGEQSVTSITANSVALTRSVVNVNVTDGVIEEFTTTERGAVYLAVRNQSATQLTLKHNQAKLRLIGAVDYKLNQYEALSFVRIGTGNLWQEVGRAPSSTDFVQATGEQGVTSIANNTIAATRSAVHVNVSNGVITDLTTAAPGVVFLTIRNGHATALRLVHNVDKLRLIGSADRYLQRFEAALFIRVGTENVWHEVGRAPDPANTVETGTFTPQIGFVTNNGNLAPTYSTQVGQYTKIGKLVYVNFLMIFSVNNYSGTSGGLRVTGLPFPAISGQTPNLGISRLANVTFSGALVLNADSTGSAPFRRYVSAGNDGPLGPAAIPPNTSGIAVGATGVYQTA